METLAIILALAGIFGALWSIHDRLSEIAYNLERLANQK